MQSSKKVSNNTTRVDLKLKHPLEWTNSSDDVGSYALENNFGNTFRSIFVVCDIEVLTAAGFLYQAVRNYLNIS